MQTFFSKLDFLFPSQTKQAYIKLEFISKRKLSLVFHFSACVNYTKYKHCKQNKFIPKTEIMKYDNVLWEVTYLIQTTLP